MNFFLIKSWFGAKKHDFLIKSCFGAKNDDFSLTKIYFLGFSFESKEREKNTQSVKRPARSAGPESQGPPVPPSKEPLKYPLLKNL